MSKVKYVVTFLAAAALTVSCSKHHPIGDPGDDDGDDSGGGTDGGGGSGSTDGGFGSCAATYVQATLKPLDIYIMLDQSGSMADDNKWTNVTAAINTFVTQPDVTGMSVALGYFANTDTASNECTVSNYSTPSVAMAALPGAATAISTSITGHSPTSDTPTLPAEEGATQYASSWATMNPTDEVIVVLATDGEPNGCSSTVAKVAAAAGSAYAATPSIPTYVIGVGTSTGNLDMIAAGGGTGSAFIVDTGSDAGSAFLAALNSIRGDSLGCTYTVPAAPAGQTLDYNEVNVVYTPGGSTTQEVIPQVSGSAACPATGDAWYYDNPSAPTEIVLCTNTCTTIQADTNGSVNIGLGCTTVIP